MKHCLSEVQGGSQESDWWTVHYNTVEEEAREKHWDKSLLWRMLKNLQYLQRLDRTSLPLHSSLVFRLWQKVHPDWGQTAHKCKQRISQSYMKWVELIRDREPENAVTISTYPRLTPLKALFWQRVATATSSLKDEKRQDSVVINSKGILQWGCWIHRQTPALSWLSSLQMIEETWSVLKW